MFLEFESFKKGVANWVKSPERSSNRKKVPTECGNMEVTVDLDKSNFSGVTGWLVEVS